MFPFDDIIMLDTVGKYAIPFQLPTPRRNHNNMATFLRHEVGIKVKVAARLLPLN